MVTTVRTPRTPPHSPCGLRAYPTRDNQDDDAGSAYRRLSTSQLLSSRKEASPTRWAFTAEPSGTSPGRPWRVTRLSRTTR